MAEMTPYKFSLLQKHLCSTSSHEMVSGSFPMVRFTEVNTGLPLAIILPLHRVLILRQNCANILEDHKSKDCSQHRP